MTSIKQDDVLCSGPQAENGRTRSGADHNSARDRELLYESRVILVYCSIC